MSIARRRFLQHVGGSAASPTMRVAAGRAAPSRDAAPPMPDLQEMQVARRGGLYGSLKDPLATQLPPDAFALRLTYSPAPQAYDPGRWIDATSLPLPRSEMAEVVSEGNRMHVTGGRRESRGACLPSVFDASRGAWLTAAPIPRGANHVGVAAVDGVIYAFGSFVEQTAVARLARCDFRRCGQRADSCDR